MDFCPGSLFRLGMLRTHLSELSPLKKSKKFMKNHVFPESTSNTGIKIFLDNKENSLGHYFLAHFFLNREQY